MRFSAALLAASLISTVAAHFQLQYPPPRGEFDEDNEPTLCGMYLLFDASCPAEAECGAWFRWIHLCCYKPYRVSVRQWILHPEVSFITLQLEEWRFNPLLNSSEHAKWTGTVFAMLLRLKD